MNIADASKYHRYIVLGVLGFFVAAIFLGKVPSLQALLNVCAWISNIYWGYKLASAIGKSGPLWICLGIIGPFLLWIPHLLLLNSSNKIFKQHGLKIGFFGGASKAG